MERSCNGVYFRNNSLLHLKATRGRAACLSYPECVCRWWKEEQWKELQKAGDGARRGVKKGLKSCSFKMQGDLGPEGSFGCTEPEN